MPEPTFTRKLVLGTMFYDWCRETYSSPSPENMITFLQKLGLFNDKKAIEFVENLKDW